MKTLIDLSSKPGDDRLSQPPILAPDTRSSSLLPRTTRRVLLALGGFLASGTATLAATGEGRRSSPAAEARLKLARTALEAVRVNLARGLYKPGERDPISIWSRRRLEARLDLSATKQERVSAAQEHLDEMKAAERLVSRMYETGQIDLLAKLDAEYRRLEAESWLEQEQEKTKT
jgi:hypothetical protein